MPSGNTRVALRKESVDRKSYCATQSGRQRVALRKESVDRKNLVINLVQGIGVALRKESVDRKNDTSKKNATRSLSARRAWIENLTLTVRNVPIDCRSPQGERG